MTPMLSLSFAETLRGAVWQPASQTPAAPSEESRMNWRRFILVGMPRRGVPARVQRAEGIGATDRCAAARGAGQRSALSLPTADLGGGSRQTFDFPTVTIRAAQKLIRLLHIRHL